MENFVRKTSLAFTIDSFNFVDACEQMDEVLENVRLCEFDQRDHNGHVARNSGKNLLFFFSQEYYLMSKEFLVLYSKF